MSELKGVIDQIGAAFAAYKEANDQRMAELSAKGNVSAELAEKIARIDTDLTELDSLKGAIERLEAAAARPNLGQKSEAELRNEEHKAKFMDFVRKGVDFEQKDYTTSTDPDGGYAVPEILDRRIIELVQEFSDVRRYATVDRVSTPDIRKLVNVHGTNAGWVGCDDPRPTTENSQLNQIVPTFGELYAQPQATQCMLEDVFFDAERWIMDEIRQEFAIMEGFAFLKGDGVNKPTGLLAIPNSTDVDGTRNFGTYQKIESGGGVGVIGTDAEASQSNLLDMIYATKPAHRNRSAWYMSRDAIATVRKIYTTDGLQIWQPSLQAGEPSTLLGYPVRELVDLDDTSALGNEPVLFGDMAMSYWVLDRVGTSMLRDPYTNKPFVRFYTRKRVGGYPLNTEAYKALEITS